MKIVISPRYGGFGLSKEAFARYQKENPEFKSYDAEIPRNCPILVKIVEEMGAAADGPFASLKIVEVDEDDGSWYVHDYDGYESIRYPENFSRRVNLV